jgi:diguanylate cyclase (GGDEF)-like protein/PAS domain S-box-containing protein
MQKNAQDAMSATFGLIKRWLFRNWVVDAPRRPAVDFRHLAESSNDVIINCEMDGKAKYASPSIMQLLGIAPEEIIGKSHLSFVLPEDIPAIEATVAQHATGQSDGTATFRMKRRDGTIVWVEGRGRKGVDPATGNAEFVIVMRDITERKALETKLAMLASTDGLTGLANRRAFDEALEKEWRRAQRSGAELSLLLLDLDRFKSFNDHYGHQVGDDCLRTVAAAIGKTLRRAGDLAARYGGEEIAIILPATDSAGAIEIGSAMRTAIEALCIPHQHNIEGDQRVTVSIGVATALSRVGGSVQMPAALLQAADIALYKAKQNGRNRLETALLLTADQATTGTNAA